MERRLARAWMVGLSLAGGCGADCVDCALDSDAEEPPTHWSYEEPLGEPVRSAAQLELLLPGALDALLAVDIPQLLEVYDGLLAYGDRGCPVVAPVAHREGWSADCTASSGAHFAGRAAALHLTEEQGVRGQGDVEMAVLITDPMGRVFEGDGASVWSDLDHDGARHFEGWIVGSFGFPPAGGWLTETHGVGLQVRSEDAGRGQRWLELDGGVELLDQGFAVRAEPLRLYSAETGVGCSAEPWGSLHLRFHDGERFEVVFDGPESLEDAEWDCDGCGALLFGEEAIGEVCMDPSAMLAWSGRPW